MNLRDVLERRRASLLAEWHRNPFFQVQVEHSSALGRLVFINGFEQGSVSQVGRRRTGNTVCVERPGNPHTNKSLWVRSGYGDYRQSYVDFLKYAYGLKADATDLEHYDVDHLLNRGRSPSDSVFIRIEAVPKGINRQWGSLYERALSTAGLYGDTVRERRTLRWTVASKLAGQSPPSGPDDTAGIERLAAFWATQGFSAEEARNGLSTDLARVFGTRPTATDPD